MIAIPPYVDTIAGMFSVQIMKMPMPVGKKGSTPAKDTMRKTDTMKKKFS